MRNARQLAIEAGQELSAFLEFRHLSKREFLLPINCSENLVGRLLRGESVTLRTLEKIRNRMLDIDPHWRMFDDWRTTVEAAAAVYCKKPTDENMEALKMAIRNRENWPHSR